MLAKAAYDKKEYAKAKELLTKALTYPENLGDIKAANRRFNKLLDYDEQHLHDEA